MSTVTELMAEGLAAGPASQIGSTAGTALVAAGTTKATALQLLSTAAVFVTVTTAAAGALLPRAGGSPVVSIYNGGAATLSVYAASTDVINANSAGAAFSVTTGKSASFAPAGNRWIGNLSA